MDNEILDYREVLEVLEIEAIKGALIPLYDSQLEESNYDSN